MRLSVLCALVALSNAQTPADGPITYASAENFNSCRACIDSGRNLCLSGHSASSVKFNVGYCCPTSGLSPIGAGQKCWESFHSFYCSSTTKTPQKHAADKGSRYITDPTLQEMTCPAYDKQCPSDADSIILVTDSTVVSRNIGWGFGKDSMPNKAYNWNCKYKSSIETTAQKTLMDANLVDGKATKGFLTVRVESYGFGGTIKVVGQENGKWIDYTEGTTDNVRVYTDVKFSQKFFFPADWDVFVSFEPTQNWDNKAFNSDNAYFDIHSAFQGAITLGDRANENPVSICYDPELIKYIPPPVVSCEDDPNQDKCVVKEKTCVQDVNQAKCSCKAYPKKPGCTAPTITCETDNTQAKCVKACLVFGKDRPKYCPFVSCTDKPDQPRCDCKMFPRMDHCKCKAGATKNLQGTCVVPDEPWLNKELFKIGNLKITTAVLGTTAIVLIVIGGIVFLIMSIIAYRKRKAIAAGARRASDYVRRASQKLRSSVSGNRQAEGQDKAKPVNDINKDMMELQNQAAPTGGDTDKKLNDAEPEKLDGAPEQEEHNFGIQDQPAQGDAKVNDDLVVPRTNDEN